MTARNLSPLQKYAGKIKSKLKKLLKRVSPFEHMVEYDCVLWKKHIGCITASSKNALSAEIMMRSHGLEKGITMPAFRPGFGTEKIPLLATAMKAYLNKGGRLDDFEYKVGVAILKEYLQIHQKANYQLPHQTVSEIESVTTNSTEPASIQKVVTREDFFSHNHDSFDKFSASRHTVRNFSGPAPMEDVREAIQIASNAPSACNRQYVKVHIYQNPAIMEQMRAMQGGTNGFGHLAGQVILITADLSALMWMHERHDAWNNAGIFLMNLCHALHFKEIGACICAWSVAPETDRAMHQLGNIPDSEVITSMLLIGKLPDKFLIALSPRKEYTKFMVEH